MDRNEVVPASLGVGEITSFEVLSELFHVDLPPHTEKGDRLEGHAGMSRSKMVWLPSAVRVASRVSSNGGTP
jgi:hypothetical protein